MKKITVFGYIFATLSIIAPYVAFCVSTEVGNADTFHMPGMLGYTWIMWLFIPIGIISIVLGICLKRRKGKCLFNLIAGGLAVFLLFTFGSFRFIFAQTVSYDNSCFENVETKLNYQLSDEVQVAAQLSDDYTTVYAKINKDYAKHIVDKKVQTDTYWSHSLPTALKGVLPSVEQAMSSVYQYFIVYNETLREFNKTPQRSGTYKFVYVMYNIEKGEFLLLDNYSVQFVV